MSRATRAGKRASPGSDAPTALALYDRWDPLEKELASNVINFARLHGWMVFWTWNSLHSPKGEPDLRMYRRADGRVVLAELKRRTGKLTAEQQVCLPYLAEVATFNPLMSVHVWRPIDWVDGTIQEVLR